MTVARIVNGQMTDRREINLADLPAHKVETMGWKTVIEQGEGPIENWALVGNDIVITKSYPPITAANVKAEAQRRIIARVGAPDLTQCIIKQLNANMRANELNDIRHERELTTEEAAEAEALRQLALDIKDIRAKSDEIEAIDPIPADFNADLRWE